MKRKEGFVLREVCGEKVIVGEGLGAVDFGRLISLNETAAWLWQQLDRISDTDALTAAMCQEYDVEPQVAKHDIEALLSEWVNSGLLEE